MALFEILFGSLGIRRNIEERFTRVLGQASQQDSERATHSNNGVTDSAGTRLHVLVGSQQCRDLRSQERRESGSRVSCLRFHDKYHGN
jgi:hypothetical protein